MPAYLAAILRMLIGAGFLWVGLQKFFDVDLLYGGLMRRIEEHGDSFPLYGDFLLRYVEINQDAYVLALAIGEVLVGTSFLLGMLVSLGAVAGVFLVLNIALATTYGDLPGMTLHLCLAAVLLLLGRGGAGLTWGLDGWLTRYLNDAVVLFPLRRHVPSPPQIIPVARPLRPQAPPSAGPVRRSPGRR